MIDDCNCTSGAGEEWKIFHCQLHDAAPDLLAACKAFVEAYEKSLQLVKTDVAVRMARQAIEKAQVRLYYKPDVSFRTGLERMIEWVKENDKAKISQSIVYDNI